MEQTRPIKEPVPYMQRVPFEVLLQIFHIVDTPKVQGFNCRTRILHRRIDSLGLHLGAVCRQWRNTVLSSPSLWASIQVDITNNIYRTEMLDALSATLSRSASSNLMIIIDFDDDAGINLGDPVIADAITSPLQPDPDSPNLIVTALLRMLFAQPERIRHLITRGNQNALVDLLILPILTSLNGRFQEMLHLDIDIPVNEDDQYECGVMTDLFRFIECAPSIRELGLRLCWPRIDCFQHLTCPLTLLTRLHIRATTEECIWFFLRKCPNLESALFSLIPTFDQFEIPYDISCNHLHTFSISYDTFYHRENLPFSFLNSISLPSLTNLTIGTLPTKALPYIFPDIAVFRPFILRNGAGIRVFTLDRFPALPSEVERLFQHTPEVRKLVIIEPNWIDRRTGLSNKNYTANIDLTEALKDTRSLPKLEELRLYVNSNWVETGLEEMVQARRFMDVYVEIRDDSDESVKGQHGFNDGEPNGLSEMSIVCLVIMLAFLWYTA
ncbi:hypothetical protein VNI00_015614 [Paramarasmius palmivorus]|uniref:F-box domain-containing protein n=1 Tax=Paramarasmius palmivorus TaxID=297713 RepID=A0AAW0BK57_9AGAR